jgi:alpha-glucosidase (family GH31 glycosyl hydrolase)
VDDPAPVLELFRGSPEEVLRAFLDATAPPVLPPSWVFGPWMSGNEWNTQERVLAEVERGEREGIPASVLVIEAWSDEQTFTAFRDAEYPVHEDGSPHRLADFRFPAEGAWPDPVGLVDTLHAKGIKVLLWQIPLLKTGAPAGSQLACDRRVLVDRGFGVRQGDGRPYANRGWWFPRALMPDFTSEEATRWWTEKRRYLVDEVGIDGFKTDGGEHAWGADLRYADGTTGAETNNRYPVLYAQAYHDLLRRAGVEGVTFSRAGYTGAAAAPCHWAGDEDSTWEAFRASVTAGITAGASGVFFWGWDLAGFSGDIPSAELYLRAAAMACFCPIMQYHSEFNHHRTPSRDRTPWNIGERTGDQRVVPIYRRFARLRMRLVPYLEEEARHAVERRTPLMKALFFDAPDDERGWGFPHQYFLGRHLLVAPVVEPGAETWDVYLPEGDWVDVWSGDRIRGGHVVTRDVPLDVVPVYAAAPRWEALRPLFHDLEED